MNKKNIVRIKDLKIIDFKKAGNVIRLFAGTGDDYWGDDWDDTPYEHNAGPVYDQYIIAFVDIGFPVDTIVTEPSDDWHYNGNSPYCKEDFKKNNAPCLIINKAPEDISSYPEDEYSRLLGDKNTKHIYFNDDFKKTIDDLCNDWGGVFVFGNIPKT